MYSSEVKLSYEVMESILSQNEKEPPDGPAPDISLEESALDISLMSNTYEDNAYFSAYFDNDWNIRHTEEHGDEPEKDNKPPHYPVVTDDFPAEYPEFTKPFPSNEPTLTTTLPSRVTTKLTTTTRISNPNKTTGTDPIEKNANTKKSEPKASVAPSEKNTSTNSEGTENTHTSPPDTKGNTEHSIPEKKPIDEINKPTEPDPFRGKVKRSYVYVEFSEINDLEEAIYQYYTSEDAESVKSAVNEIYNSNDERGKISIGNNKYRYIYRYNPVKSSYSIVMLDRTLEINTINRLLFIFVIIAGISLILIFFISLLLANWTIKPVAKAWNQQKEFIANASHELKTPLTVISTNTDVVLSNPEDTVENQSKWLNYIKNETFRMSKLVNNLLCIAKYDAKRIETTFTKVDFSNIVSSICLQYEPLAYENRKNLITEIDDNIEILADEDKIKQIVNILMDNALKYSLENGTIKITLKKVKQSSACLTVSNSSENISQENLDKIFDRFYRVDDSRNRKTGGSGLGLNIAKTIIENHNGTIRAVNKDNITSFIVTL